MSDEVIAVTDLVGLYQVAVYFCRGCGKPLPDRSKARFHAECRRADKRRRIAERRQRHAAREAKLVRKHLRLLNCPDCGASLAKLVQSNPSQSAEPACDVAQGAPERLNFEGRSTPRNPIAERVMNV
jgi:hypothetical protein